LNISIEASLKQTKYCLTNNLTMSAPSGGICPNCRKSIYKDYERMTIGVSSGYTLDEASSTHITQCPHCMYVFKERAIANEEK